MRISIFPVAEKIIGSLRNDDGDGDNNCWLKANLSWYKSPNYLDLSVHSSPSQLNSVENIRTAIILKQKCEHLAVVAHVLRNTVNSFQTDNWCLSLCSVLHSFSVSKLSISRTPLPRRTAGTAPDGIFLRERVDCTQNWFVSRCCFKEDGKKNVQKLKTRVQVYWFSH